MDALLEAIGPSGVVPSVSGQTSGENWVPRPRRRGGLGMTNQLVPRRPGGFEWHQKPSHEYSRWTERAGFRGWSPGIGTFLTVGLKPRPAADIYGMASSGWREGGRGLGSTAGRSGSEDASTSVGGEEVSEPFTFPGALGEVAD